MTLTFDENEEVMELLYCALPNMLGRMKMKPGCEVALSCSKLNLLVSKCHLLITFANSLDPDQARRFVGPDLGPICLKNQQKKKSSKINVK